MAFDAGDAHGFQITPVKGERVPAWVALLLIVLGTIGFLSITYVYVYPRLL